MQVLKSRFDIHDVVENLHIQGKKIGFVPMMGCLHEGHLSLLRKARLENDCVIASIFVNPKQFGVRDDFDRYPRDLEKDKTLIGDLADYLFCPTVTEIYPHEEQLLFTFKTLTQSLCGVSRPYHFEGVALVVTKLFHIIQPDYVYFGQKDYQQTLVIKKLIEDLFFPVIMKVCPTVREEDGLAMSSRNAALSSEERHQAAVLYQALQYGLYLLHKGQKDPEVIICSIAKIIQSQPLAKIDYVDIRKADDLHQISRITDETVLIAVAAYFGHTRLIDNVLYAFKE